MEQVADCNLEEYLIKSPFLVSQKPTLRSFYGSLSSAIAYLHREKVRHKDLKPANILVKNSKILITDFGTSNPIAFQFLASDSEYRRCI